MKKFFLFATLIAGIGYAHSSFAQEHKEYKHRGNNKPVHHEGRGNNKPVHHEGRGNNRPVQHEGK